MASRWRLTSVTSASTVYSQVLPAGASALPTWTESAPVESVSPSPPPKTSVDACGCSSSHHQVCTPKLKASLPGGLKPLEARAAVQCTWALGIAAPNR